MKVVNSEKEQTSSVNWLKTLEWKEFSLSRSSVSMQEKTWTRSFRMTCTCSSIVCSVLEAPALADRQDTAKSTPTNHHCESFTGDLLIPDPWSSVLSCRVCKKELTLYIADEMLALAVRTIRRTQQFVTNIGETTYSVAPRSSRIPQPYLRSNADEGDLRVWLHCLHSIGSKKLVFSPDVYHIGMTQMSCMPDTDVIVQLSKPSDKESKFIHMNNLLLAIENDPDLFELLPSIRPQVLQSLYVTTGCDYISFFSGLGKASFLGTLFQYATFIAKGEDPPGSIGTVSLDRDSPSLYSFLRLIGCKYFRKHTSLFAPQTPVTLFWPQGYMGPPQEVVGGHSKQGLEDCRPRETKAPFNRSTSAALVEKPVGIGIVAFCHTQRHRPSR